MLAGTAASVIQQASQDEGDADSKRKILKDNLAAFGTVLVHSQQAVKILDEYGLVETAYLILKHHVGPSVQRVSLAAPGDSKSPESMSDFDRLLFKMECHIFAQRQHRKLIEDKEQIYIQKVN